MKISATVVLFLFFLTAPFSSHAAPPSSFSSAKKVAIKLFEANPVTLYCQCRYQTKVIDLQSCGMESASIIKRAHRMEWEHMMPAENFGRHLPCWTKKLCSTNDQEYKGRKCCIKRDAFYRKMEGELYNLWPAVGLVNQERSNFRFGVLDKTESFYGCDFKIDKVQRRAEPADAAKGVVARANLMMSEHYHIALSPSQEKLFLAWDRQFGCYYRNGANATKITIK